MSTVEVSSLFIGHPETKFLSSGTPYESWSYSANHVGGVGVKHSYYNASDKAIKYLTFVYEAYNAVDDKVACQTSGEYLASGRLTGPIQPGEEYEVKWDVFWYNPTITRVEIAEVRVEFMDGTEETIAGAHVLSMYDDESEYGKKLAAEKAEEEARKAEEAARKQQQKEENMKALNDLKNSVVGGLKGLFKKK